MISYRLRLPSKYLAEMYEAHFTGRSAENRARFDYIRKDLGYCEFGSADGDDGETREVFHETFDSSELVLYYYERLIDLLSDNGVSVVVAQPPINEASDAVMHREFVDGYTEYLNYVEHRRRYHDLTMLTRIPVYSNELFGDSIHVNRKGAEVFTGELKEYLESAGFW